MLIRPAERTDATVVSRLVDAAYGPFMEQIGRTPAPMLDDYVALTRRGVVDVALDSDVIVGAIVHWPVVFDGGNGHWFVDNIAVDPAHQGSGIGGMLLARAEVAALSGGFEEIRLYTNEAMMQNQEWYPKLGFVETHRRLDRGYSRVFYSRPVTPSN